MHGHYLHKTHSSAFLYHRRRHRYRFSKDHELSEITTTLVNTTFSYSQRQKVTEELGN